MSSSYPYSNNWFWQFHYSLPKTQVFNLQRLWLIWPNLAELAVQSIQFSAGWIGAWLKNSIQFKLSSLLGPAKGYPLAADVMSISINLERFCTFLSNQHNKGSLSGTVCCEQGQFRGSSTSFWTRHMRCSWTSWCRVMNVLLSDFEDMVDTSQDLMLADKVDGKELKVSMLEIRCGRAWQKRVTNPVMMDNRQWWIICQLCKALERTE